jgi:hypothetical protein
MKKEITRGMEDGEALRQGDGSGEFVLLARTVAQSSTPVGFYCICMCVLASFS